jgi:hypothetical protein
MRKVLFVVVVLLGCVIGLGLWRGWFGFSTSRDPETGQRGVQFNLDPNKMKSDVQKARDRVGGSVSPAQEQRDGK